MLALVCSCSDKKTELVSGKEKGERRSNGHSILCMIFLSKDEKMNAETITIVKKLTKSLQHKFHPIIFTPQSQQAKAAQDIIDEYGVSKFPAVVIDGKMLAEDESLEEVCKEASGRKTITISQHLATDVLEEKHLVTMFYICCFEEGEYIDDGRVMVYVVENNKHEDRYLPNIFRALIADSKEYNVESGSCHAPETVYWEIPEGTDPKSLRVVMAIYDSDGKILGTCCSAEDCTERAREE